MTHNEQYINEQYIPTNKETLKNRWISILRMKAEYEHEARKNGEVVPRPSIDDICNEIDAFFTGLED